MAYIKKRGKSWQAQVSWYDERNNRKYKTKSGFATKMQAKKWANEFEVAKDKNLISDQDPIFADYFEEWYKRYKAPGKSNNTKNRYAHIYLLLKETFGKTKLSKMSVINIRTFLMIMVKIMQKIQFRKLTVQLEAA